MWLESANGIKIERADRGGGTYMGGPWKIVHHTTEGGFPGSLSTLEDRHVESHFLVGTDRIVQFIDTERASRSLENHPGGVQTNNDEAIQLELVGEAAKPKDRGVLANAAAICRQLEERYRIPRVWPNGYPTPYPCPASLQNRNPVTWDTRSGHFGHCHVPENYHGDPGYTREEADFVVPPEVLAGLEYTVVAGDGLFGVARRFGLEIGDLLSLNNLTVQSIIHPGDVLKLA